MKRTVAVNDRGYRIGEDHHNAKLTNHEVELIIEIYEPWKTSMQDIADKFDISKSQVRNIVNGVKRNQTPFDYRSVHLIDS